MGHNGGEEMEAEYIFPFLRFDSYKVHFECESALTGFCISIFCAL